MVKRATFKLDLHDERLWHGDQIVEISNKAFQMLRLLVSHPDRLLTKEDILDTIWRDVCVSEGLIKEYIHDLRLALGDDPKKPKIIETVRGRGYRFLGGVEVLDQPLMAKGVANPKGPSIAILPFANLSCQPEEEYIADGLSEEIITALSFVPWLFVIARNSSFSYRGSAVDVRQVGADLNVRYVLEGSLRRAGSRLRVTGRLIDTETATQIWANHFESTSDDIFNLQDEVTEAVVNAIGPEVQLAEIQRAIRKRPSNLTAYDLYLRARAALNSFQIDSAIELLDEAIKLAPDYAKAKAVRAWCTTLIGWRYVAPTDAQRETSTRLAEEALRSPEVDAETRAYAGYAIGFMSDQRRRAISLVEDVTSQCPSFAWAWASLALLESYHGDARRAIKLAETALRLNPRDPQSFRCEMALAKAYLVQNQYLKSLACADQGLEKSPSNSFFQICRITCLVKLGRIADAIATGENFQAQHPEFRISKWHDLTQNWGAWDSTSKTLDESLRRVGIPD